MLLWSVLQTLLCTMQSRFCRIVRVSMVGPNCRRLSVYKRRWVGIIMTYIMVLHEVLHYNIIVYAFHIVVVQSVRYYGSCPVS